jgi:hypothetical protein
MKSRFGICIICLLLLSVYGHAQMATVVVTNPPSSTVTIELIDSAHPETIPSGLRSHILKLPLGSFLLYNHLSTPITAVVTQWEITSRTGVVEKEKLQCTGYKIPPRKAMVRPNDFSLITPHSCVKSELFPQLGNAAFNSPFQLANGRRLVDRPDDIARIEMTVDSIIFEDGGIWGPDTQKYYRKLWQDDLALRSVVKECSEAATRGEDIKGHAKKIGDDLVSTSDGESALRKRYASILFHSPDPKRTLSQLGSREALPEFHHIEEGKE